MRRMSSSATGVSVRRAARYGILWPFDFMKSTVIVTGSLLAIRPRPKPALRAPRAAARPRRAPRAPRRAAGRQRRLAFREPALFHRGIERGHELARTLPQRRGHGAAERLGPVLALGGDRDADHFSQRLEGLAGMAGALESGECRIPDPLRFLERTLARHTGGRRPPP